MMKQYEALGMPAMGVRQWLSAPLIHSAFACGMGGALLIAASLWQMGPAALVTGIVVLVASIAWFLAVIAREAGGSSLPCPSCREPIIDYGDLAPDDIAECCACGVYCSRASDGSLRLIPEDHEAASALFQAPLPYGDIQWAPGCAVCSHAPCDLEPVAVEGHGYGRILGVPFCRRHCNTGAARATTTARTGAVVLKFRSHRAVRRFRVLNPR
jgi:hypothetical protein